jgi:hypothetical protein
MICAIREQFSSLMNDLLMNELLDHSLIELTCAFTPRLSFFLIHLHYLVIMLGYTPEHFVGNIGFSAFFN